MSGQKCLWGYDNDNGPHTWCRQYPKAAGAFQSPINIDPASAIYAARLNNPPLHFNYQQALTGCSLCNNGHSFQVSTESDTASMEGGPLISRYQFAQFHMHWGSGNGWGSEHALDGKLFPAELHLVHWNSKKFTSSQEAAAIKDGLAVLGVFVEVGLAHPALERVLSRFEAIRQPDSKTSISGGINLADFLPSNTTEFFTYEGSLTTPPCFESVQWIVFRKPITMSQEQLDRLRSLKGRSQSSDQQLVNNYRHLIPLGSRKLYTTCKTGSRSE
ncbi:hypothetical protein BOX15_Mlig017567g1 [Macrostomum lignano]|uniref:Carbonic anhydrase n=2 Tax=Macrostomum lignano TaxID=282301 RepID=A0A1I8G1T1_9PLAT|nr:hypothetical protein BOX15_Mlig017567g2 [Macrostomum lignano]PAA87204.1 hypothetical protein BOX15_Mlig017567g1 [Macrostomum lignano]